MRGKPGTGPYAGRGSQHKAAKDPKTGRVHNEHYLKYGKKVTPKPQGT